MVHADALCCQCLHQKIGKTNFCVNIWTQKPSINFNDCLNSDMQLVLFQMAERSRAKTIYKKRVVQQTKSRRDDARHSESPSGNPQSWTKFEETLKQHCLKHRPESCMHGKKSLVWDMLMTIVPPHWCSLQLQLLWLLCELTCPEGGGCFPSCTNMLLPVLLENCHFGTMHKWFQKCGCNILLTATSAVGFFGSLPVAENNGNCFEWWHPTSTLSWSTKSLCNWNLQLPKWFFQMQKKVAEPTTCLMQKNLTFC